MTSGKDLGSLSLEEKIGQMLVIGFPSGQEGLEHIERAAAEFGAGNAILFSRNIGSPEEVFRLTARLRSILGGRTGLAPFISVDQEGGSVARLRSGVTPIIGAMAQASAVAGGRRSLDDVRRLGLICGSELAALGINWDLAPVADVNVNPANPVIGVRSYGEDPRLVADLAAAFAAGLAEGGVMATAKHFPGHGDTNVDSHLGLPTILHGMERLESVELVPFRRLIAEGIGAVMTAHVRFPALEARALPATLSAAVIQGLLRERLGFKGIVTTDCMEMKAIADNFPDAAVMAVKAGADIIDVSHTYELQKAAALSIAAAVRNGEIPEERIDESVARIAAAKSRLAAPPSSWEEAAGRVAVPSSLSFAEGFSRDSLALVREGSGLPLARGGLYVDIAPENLTGVEDDAKGRGAMGAALASVASAAPRIETVTLGLDPSAGEIASVLAKAGGRDIAVGLYGAAAHPGQAELVRALAASATSGGHSIGLVSMRSPYDAALFPGIVSGPGERGGAAFLCAFEYSPASVRSVAAFLAGNIPAAGLSPVGRARY
jgi:beta-N-acetylhexosaminidase